MDRNALTKIQSIILIAVVTLTVVFGIATYVLFSSNPRISEPIRIGVCADLDNTIGKGILRAAILAAEEVNSNGGVLGRNFTIVAEDDDSEVQPDMTVASNAMTRLTTVDKANFVVTESGLPETFSVYEAICAQNNVIMLTTGAAMEEFTQKVIDDYTNYKYFFKLFAPNSTAIGLNLHDSIVTVGKYTGFTKVAFLCQDLPSLRQIISIANNSLTADGFEVVYTGFPSPGVTDFTSYFAAIEASGAEILCPYIVTRATVPFVKEWRDRESPCVVAGFLAAAGDPTFWDATEGKCEYVSMTNPPFIGGYNLTSKSASTREAYLQRWGTPIPSGFATAAYDGIRFILSDAIKRAGTIETEAVIKALESTNIETTLARHFVYTKSHDIMMPTADSGVPPEDYQLVGLLQWQPNRALVPVVPESIMNEAGATYKFPFWQGPWNR